MFDFGICEVRYWHAIDRWEIWFDCSCVMYYDPQIGRVYRMCREHI